MVRDPHGPSSGNTSVILRGIAIWVVIALAETVHGIARRLVLVPLVGEFRAGQIGVVVGAAIILAIATVCVRWIGARTAGQQIGVGLTWLGLMLGFELALGRLVFGYTWARLGAEFDISKGGLLACGMLVLTLAPLMAARVRRSI